MFNGHLAQRRMKNFIKKQQEYERQVIIKNQYHHEIQPLLLYKYNKRLKSFIHKMEQSPIVVNPQNLLPPVKPDPHFTFKQADDWKSIYNFRQRKEIEETRKRQHTIGPQSFQSSNQYKSPRQQFRQRTLEKQIHPPMRYTNKTTEILQPLIKMKKEKKKIDQEKRKRKQSQFKELKTSDLHSNQPKENNLSNTSNSYRDQDEIQFNFNKERIENIEIQARKYEKLREVDQKKTHFKQIATIITVGKDKTEKRQLKELMRKCGLIRVKKTQYNAESTELDKFDFMIRQSK